MPRAGSAAPAQNGGTDPITYTYRREAEVTVTDAAATRPRLVQRPRPAGPGRGSAGRHLQPTLRRNGNLVSFTDAAGDTYQYTYDSNGNLTQIVNPLGQTVQMTYNSLSNLTSITDAASNTTQYSYMLAGNLLSITYPDGTQQSFTYDPLGNLTETIQQNGDPVSYQYNAQGLVTPGDLRRRHQPDLHLRRPRQPADGANLRCHGNADRHHHPDLQRRQRADLDHLSERPVLDFHLQRPGPAHPERRPDRLHDQLQLTTRSAGCPS